MKTQKWWNQPAVVVVASLTLLCCSSAQAQAVPDTGQKKCYNSTGEIACPSPGQDFYGQDANCRGSGFLHR